MKTEVLEVFVALTLAFCLFLSFKLYVSPYFVEAPEEMDLFVLEKLESHSIRLSSLEADYVSRVHANDLNTIIDGVIERLEAYQEYDLYHDPRGIEVTWRDWGLTTSGGYIGESDLIEEGHSL